MPPLRCCRPAAQAGGEAAPARDAAAAAEGERRGTRRGASERLRGSPLRRETSGRADGTLEGGV